MDLTHLILPVINIILLLSILVLLFFYYFKSQKRSGEVEEFKLAFNCFDSILTSYKQYVLTPKIKNLSKDHNLDPNSESNSINVFNLSKEKIIKEAVNDIFKEYINQNTINILETYYTRDGLLLFILTYFRG